MNETEFIDQLAGMTSPELRQSLATAKVAIRNAGEAIKGEELRIREECLAQVGGDAKQLGSNEAIREDKYRVAYGLSTAWLKAKASMVENLNNAEIIEAVLNGRLDTFETRKLDAMEERTQVLYKALEKERDLIGLAS